MFKTLFTAEDYLKLNTNRQQRSLMALVDSQIYVILLLVN